MLRRIGLLAVYLCSCSCGGGGSGGQDASYLDAVDASDPADASAPVAPVYQPGFHEALRWADYAPGQTTYRFKLPIGRAGSRLKIVLRSGDGPLQISRATVGYYANGTVTSIKAIGFGGLASVSLGQARQLAESDPVELAVAFHQELVVSFVALGSLAASAIELFPGSVAIPGDHASDPLIAGAPQATMLGLTTIYVEAPTSSAFVALGDSITEGYIEGGVGRSDDYRNSWPYVVEGILGAPVVNAAVSGQGLWSELQDLNGEVLTLKGITDCAVLLGTNDLGSGATDIESNLTKLYSQLRPFCRVWGLTLPPKDRPATWPDRQAVNQWMRAKPLGLDQLVDLDTDLGVAPTFNTWLPGLAVDGIHPTVLGNSKIGSSFSAAAKARQSPPSP